MRRQASAILVTILGGSLAGSAASAQHVGHAGAGVAHDPTTMAEMHVIHQMLLQHEKITRTVTNLADGIRTVTESSDPAVAQLIKQHVASMTQRVADGSDPGLPMETPALRSIFRDSDKIRTTVEPTANGVIVVQTSIDANTVAALQQHASEVSDLARRGMTAAHEAMHGAMTSHGMHGAMMSHGMHGAMTSHGMHGAMTSHGMHGAMMSHGMHGAMTSGGAGADHAGHAGHAGAGSDSAFAALQSRGEQAMGVDQYTSTHRFDDLPDGGRIELQRDVADSAGIAQIRQHLQEIASAFASGDFSTPAFVHMREVPGAEVMAARRAAITYTYRELPRGGELRIVTSDAEALAAIHAFLAFQRQDHRAGGMRHRG